jgi:putative copper export protein/mono/diheme cytochrome c family protein/peroxiredoxin
MNTLLVIVRAVHFGAALLLLGELVFSTVVAGPALRVAVDGGDDVRRWIRAAARWSLGASIVAAVAWLGLEAALMSGLSIDDAMRGGALGIVLAKTTFGRVWVIRFGLAVLLGVLMIVDARRARRSAGIRWGALALAAGYVASLALTGHAAAGQGGEYYVRIAADATHLLAAGGWLGALPGLAYLLATMFVNKRRAPAGVVIDVAADAARRFSALGVACVGALFLSGLVNTWYLAGSVPELLGTSYGRLLLVKITLFVAMVVLAATNRLRLAPRVAGRDAAALRSLTRNAIIETVLGIAVIAIVGALGVMIPAAHQAPMWPLGFALTLEPAEASASIVWTVAVGACLACIAAAFALASARRPRASRMGLASLAFIVAAIATCPWLNVSPAYPTTYAVAPGSYSTSAIARGAATFAANCAPCHGALGRGDGPLAASLTVEPSNLIAHATHHRPGDLFWWIAHGIPPTPMPAFSERLDDVEIWNAIRYLHALADADAARTLSSRVATWRPIVAPDFTFETASRAQETLGGQRGREVLLVSYTSQSLPRLRELALAMRQLDDAGIRVVAVSATGASNAAPAEDTKPEMPTLAFADHGVASIYAMFACSAEGDCAAEAPPHVEWLIDREGYLRTRWIGVPETGAARTREVLADVEILRREPPHPRLPQGHAH